MKARTMILVVLALVCGGSVAVSVNQIAGQGRDSTPNTTVVIATKNVSRGSVISAEVLGTRKWPKAVLPPGAVTDIKDAIGRTVMVPMAQGQPLMEAMLANKEAGRGMAAMIPHGMRAFTIFTSRAESGGGGFIMPGDKVDVLLTMNDPTHNEETGGGTTTTLLQNIEVMAIAQLLDAPNSNKVDTKDLTNVTLLVSPDQAAKLDLGTNKGVLHLSLRNAEDNQDAKTRPTTVADLRFDHEKPSNSSIEWGKILIAALGSSGKPAAKAVQDQLPEPAPSNSTSIQTLRGNERGSIVIQLP